MTSRAKKISHQAKKDNIKHRKNTRKRKKKALKKAKRRIRRPKRNLLSGKHFYALEAFIRFLHKFLKDLIDKKLKPKAKQAKFTHNSLLIAWVLKCVLGIAQLSRFVEHLESNPWLSKAMGFSRALKNSKPMTELLLKLTYPLLKWLFLHVLLQAREHGLVFGKTVSIDCCFLHIHGKTYEYAEKGYSGQLKRTARGYKLWVCFSVESQMPLSLRLDSGNVGETTHFKTCIGQAGYVLGYHKLQWVLADRGFCSRELYWWLDKVMKVKFVFRAKVGRSNAYVQSAIDALTAKDFRKLGSLQSYAKTVVYGHKEQRLRLFVGKHKKYLKGMVLITNDFSIEYRTARRYYLSRWNVETFFAHQKGNFLLGKFCNTSWRGVNAQVTCSLLACVLLQIFQLLLGKRYRRFDPCELIERVLLHSFDCNFVRLMKTSYARGKALVAALQRLFTFLKSWDDLEKLERFGGYRPRGFTMDIFELPKISVIT